ncbi:MAG: rhomboid family intramembrane serine protease [Bdellovibrionales bacterium]|nr:rhomboid family intramembrane serine protease [Bdellovibrionales bacterium]
MSINYLLLWFVGISAASTAIRSFTQPEKVPRGWRSLAVLTLGLLGLSSYFFYPYAGYVVAAFWGSFVFLPRWCVALLQHFLQQGNLRYARELAQFAALLSSSPEWSELSTILQESGDDSPLPQAREVFPKTQLARSALLSTYTSRGDWTGLVRWIEKVCTRQRLVSDAVLLSLYIRSLAELGRFEEALSLFEQNTQTFLRSSDPEHLFHAFLTLFAFCGQEDGVQVLLAHPLKGLPEEVKKLWLATTKLVVDEQFSANDVLVSLTHSNHAGIATVAEERLSARVPRVLSSFEPGTLDRVARLKHFLADILNAQAKDVDAHSPRGVTFLIGLTCVAYIVQEVLGVWLGERAPYQLAALVPILVTEYGQWWRVLTCLFLHGGLLHLGMNMLGLWILGPFVEQVFGTIRFIGAYLLFGLGASLFVVFLTEIGWLKDAYLIGASGAVLGLIGATAAILLREAKNNNHAAKEQLRSVVFILVLQAAFDLTTPQVSFQAHLGGVICGFIVTWFATKPKASLQAS